MRIYVTVSVYVFSPESKFCLGVYSLCPCVAGKRILTKKRCKKCYWANIKRDKQKDIIKILLYLV